MLSIDANERIIIPDDEGVEHLFDVLFKFDIDELEQTYIVVAPVLEENDDEEIEVYAFRYEDNEDKEEHEDDFNLYPIETDEEWEMVEEMLYILESQSDDNN